MKRFTIVALVLLTSVSLSTAKAGSKKDKVVKRQPVTVKVTTPSDSLSYAIGLESTNGLLPYLQQQLHVDTAYMSDFIAGFENAIEQSKTPQGNARVAGAQIAQMVSERIMPSANEQVKGINDSINEKAFLLGFTSALKNDHSVFASTEKASKYKSDVLCSVGEKWLAENGKKPGMITLPDGLQYKVLVKGEGAKPQKTDEVEVIYEGKLIDGTVFDATYNHHPNKKGLTDLKPDKFNAGRLIKGWTEALTMMPVGSKWEIYVPQELAYGERAAGKIPPYSTLVFTLELKNIVVPEAKPEQTEPTASKTTTPVKTNIVKKGSKTAKKK
nr:FKBP-type peptidyl-prolyl cis-trans isomerase [Prevotella sp.]